ncbi:MAG: hypothetical protein PHV43_01250 [Candidatus Colwellbacteria bacterium]|nr:hypothetical protein [Candidatus Colwellbacteria bacterium]
MKTMNLDRKLRIAIWAFRICITLFSAVAIASVVMYLVNVEKMSNTGIDDVGWLAILLFFSVVVLFVLTLVLSREVRILKFRKTHGFAVDTREEENEVSGIEKIRKFVGAQRFKSYVRGDKVVKIERCSDGAILDLESFGVSLGVEFVDSETNDTLFSAPPATVVPDQLVVFPDLVDDWATPPTNT